jgi:hypothetical protein
MMSVVRKILLRQQRGISIHKVLKVHKGDSHINTIKSFTHASLFDIGFVSNYKAQKKLLDILRDLENDLFEHPSKKKNVNDFLSLDGPIVLVDLISSLVRHKKFGKYGFGGQTGPKYGVGITHLLNETCTILRELLYDIPTLAHLSTIGSIHFINLIVDSLMGIDNADTACTLLEEIVAYRTKTFLLSNINNFEQIVMTLSLRQLSLFMRIFAILIFEPENKNDDVENHGDGDIEVTLNDGTKGGESNSESKIQNTPSKNRDSKKFSGMKSPPNSPISPTLTASPISSQSSPSSITSTTTTSNVSSNPKTKKIKKTLKLLCPPTWKRRRTVHTIDSNHALLVGTPGLLRRMCRLLERIVLKGITDPSKSINSSSCSQASEQQSISHVSRILQTMILNESENSNELTELAHVLGLSPVSLRHMARLSNITSNNTTSTTNTTNTTSSLIFDEDNDDSCMDDQKQESLPTRFVNDDYSTEPIAPPLHCISPDHHAHLSKTISQLPILISHRKHLDYNQMSILQHIVEVLFVIAILLGGRRKLDTQDRLACYGISNTLSNLFDVMDWSPAHRQGSGPHGPGCQCNSKTAPKIQFLRLVHNFCARDMTNVSHRSTLFLLEDHEYIQNISHILSKHFYFGSQSTNSSSSCSNSSINNDSISFDVIIHELQSISRVEYQRIQHLVKNLDSNSDQDSYILVSGLMNKILYVLGKSKGDSPIKFWLTTCIEACIRDTNPAYQIYICLTNHSSDPNKDGTFLNKIVNEIIQGSGAGSGGLQTNFDLLAELIKLNPVSLKLLDTMLGCGDNDKRFNSFMQVVRIHLVDSNVLLRSILITIEHEKLLMGNDSSSQTRFHSYLDYSKQPDLLSDMCTTVGPNDVTQENLCCLNSSLVLLIFAYRNNQLVEYIKKLRQLETDEKIGRSGIRQHFRQLLWFWKEYYHNRATDRHSLEKSSCIEFAEFSNLVNILTSDTKIEEGSLIEEYSIDFKNVQEWKVNAKNIIQNAVNRQRH